MDEVYKLLSEFERKLAQLRESGALTAQAQQLFREFAAELDRRTGADRRQAARPGDDRRKTCGG